MKLKLEKSLLIPSIFKEKTIFTLLQWTDLGGVSTMA